MLSPVRGSCQKEFPSDADTLRTAVPPDTRNIVAEGGASTSTSAQTRPIAGKESATSDPASEAPRLPVPARGTRRKPASYRGPARSARRSMRTHKKSTHRLFSRNRTTLRELADRPLHPHHDQFTVASQSSPPLVARPCRLACADPLATTEVICAITTSPLGPVVGSM